MGSDRVGEFRGVTPLCQFRILITAEDIPAVATPSKQEILQHLGLWEESHAALARNPPVKEITFDSSYGSINSPSRGRSRDSQMI